MESKTTELIVTENRVVVARGRGCAWVKVVNKMNEYWGWKAQHGDHG